MTSTIMVDRDASGVEMLFSPVKVGAISLLHRVVHAPTTRLRAAEDLSPSAMMIEYYRQRASEGGLLITESVHPSYDSRGYEGAPGIYPDAHVKAWKTLIDPILCGILGVTEQGLIDSGLPALWKKLNQRAHPSKELWEEVFAHPNRPILDVFDEPAARETHECLPAS